jgi:CHAD domain-containing protein
MASAPPRLKHLTADLLARPARYAARVIARERLRRVRLAAPPGDEPLGEDALHDFRVALRRLRTWLRAFGRELDDTLGRGTLRRLRRLSRRTGRARDLEVQLSWLANPTIRLGPLASSAAGALADRLRAEQAAALATALELIAGELSGACRKLDKQLRRYEVRVPLEAGLHDPAMAVTLGHLLREGAGQVRATLATVTAPGQAVEAHQARLAVKHLRYLLESLGEIYRGGTRAAGRLASLQDALGVLHDRHVLLDRASREILLHGTPRRRPPGGAGGPALREPTRRAYAALHAAVERATRSEFRRVLRLANSGGTSAALATVDRLAALLGGAESAPGHPLLPDAGTPAPAADEAIAGWSAELEELPMLEPAPGAVHS